MDTFATFNSRSEALRLYNALNERGLAAMVINTPRRQGLNCGLSVQFNYKYKNTVLEIINQLRLRSFYGIYSR